jgi:16S rRNA (cytidine1402-2'-O)-methyltransferase
MLEDILEVCNPSTLLCLAVDISLDSELIKTKTIKDWKANKPDINKKPAIFIIG